MYVDSCTPSLPEELIKASTPKPTTQPALAEIQRRLKAGERIATPPPDAYYYAGLETRSPSEGYYWDGQKRGGDPKHPLLLVQITLSGTGRFTGSDGTTALLPEGWGFWAVLPSTHKYFQPPTATEDWSFFWMILRHPYVITRLAARLSETGAVWNFHQDDTTEAVHEAAAKLTLVGENLRDPLDAEAALFEFLLTVERSARAQRHGGAVSAATREQLLAETRRFVENHLTAPIGVPDLAKAKNMERSRYSHYFRAITGETPARFMTQVRLEAAARRLAETDATLDTIAAETGFADANHLCKVFRRHYHLSPGIYRKQLR